MVQNAKLKGLSLFLIGLMIVFSYRSEADEFDVLKLLGSIEDKGITPSQKDAIARVRQSIFDHIAAGAGPPGGGPITPNSPPGKRVRVIDGPANIRRGPSTDESSIMLVPIDAELEVVGEVGDWYFVLALGQTGFIHSSVVVEIRSSQAEPGLAPGGGGAESADVLDFSTASQAFADAFEGPWSFACLDQHEECYKRHHWFDCEIIMLSCIGESWLRAAF